MSASGPLVLVLGTADWDAAVATNQHRAVAALARRWPVVFAEGTGTRRLRPGDARRVLRRLLPGALRPASSRAARPVPPGAAVVAPRLVPHHGPATRALNAHLLHRQVRRWAEHPGPRVLWTYTPFAYDLPGLADATVYHLVDLLHENPGVPRARLLAAERELAGAADLAIATSGAVREHLHRQGFSPLRHLPNVADVELFAAAAAQRRAPREPVAVFAGTLAAHKVDLELLAALARRLRGTARVRLVGPVAPGTTAHPAWRALLAEGAEVVGPLGPRELAAELAAAVVGLVPYRLTPLTEGISPLKTYEYLAAGLPVVSTALPAVPEVPGAVWTERAAEPFTGRVLDLLTAPAAERAERVLRCGRAAAGHDWASRGEELRGLVEVLLTR
ncbi:glycosyltransferase [Paenibacillus sp. TRM 82003]|uniref:glycosyltransferase n=1 Tax=Kineococcus sp. TRM81007 TaxID=2925831 RepID=UPI001F572599|nr:glycosyltransferase [Kineococcus sp. TRM81007]MCI2240552.1 glycosyltransferase [Kineococcus sp. TRM81007]MCI3918931.1 glycosyltransferase [Paenibacillus sp. TRM 82003]